MSLLYFTLVVFWVSYAALSYVPFRYIYCEVDATLKIPYRKEARENVERLLRFVKLSLHEAKGGVSAITLLTSACLW